MSQTVVCKLRGGLAGAVAVEWTNVAAPTDGAAGWQACTALGGGRWRLGGSGAAAGEGPAGIGLRCRLVAGGPWLPVAPEQTALERPGPPLIPPFLLFAPALAGTGRIGAEVVVVPGAWGGVPAPDLALQWCRDGAPIPGATGRAYVPKPEDDRGRLTCRVSAASRAGAAASETAALAITHVAPEPAGTISEEIFDQGSDVQDVEAKPFFRGAALSFTVAGAGASVDALSGRISIPTEAPLSDSVTVVAANSGGSAEQSFQVTVEAAMETPAPPPARERAPQPATPTRRMPLVFRSEIGVPGYVPADASQQWHALDWCLGDPDVIYGMQDTGGIWLSRDHGRTWYLPDRTGLDSFQGLGVAVDPVDPRRVLCNMGGSYASTQPYQGLYASTDGGMTFGPRIVAGVTDSRRGTHSALAHAPASIGPRRAEKWLAIVDGRHEGAARVPIVASTDGWASWTRRGTWDQARFGPSSWMTGDRTDEGRFYVSCDAGLVRITDAFSGALGFALLSGQGGLPEGGIAGRPYVSADGRTIIVGLGRGIYRTTDGGASWSRVGREKGFAKLQVNPYDPSHMILIYAQRSKQQRPKYSTDGGTRFTATADADVERRPGLSYTPTMMYNFAHAAFHSTPGQVWLCARQTRLPDGANHYRSTDHGARWSIANEGFSGANFANRGVSPFMFSPTDRNRFALSFLDTAIWLTNSGGAYFTPSTITNAKTGRVKRTTYGVSLHPDTDRRTLFGAVGTGSAYVLVRSLDDGASWDLPLGPSTLSSGNLIAFDLDDPAYVFWGRHRNTSHGAGAWAPMPGLGEEFAVWGCTLTAPGMAAGQALFALDLRGSVALVRRSLDRGDTWTDVLAMPYDNRVVSNRYGPFRAHPRDPDVLFTKGPNGHTIRKWFLAEGTPARRPYADLNVFGAGNRPTGLTTAFELSKLAIDPRFPQVMYVLSTHAGSPRLFRTTDGGATAWTPLPEVFPLCINADAIEVAPVTGDVVMGGSNGTFVAPPPYAQEGTLTATLPGRSYLQTTAW